MRALYVDDSASEGVKRRLAPGSPRAPPPYLPIPCTAVESEPVATDVNTHFSLLTEAVRCEGIHPSSDEAKSKSCKETER